MNDKRLMSKFPFKTISAKLVPDFDLMGAIRSGEDPLEMSIAKLLWLRYNIRHQQRYIMNDGENTCALCKAYGVQDKLCEHCPVKLATGAWYCIDTPYEEYVAAENLHVSELLYIVDEWIEFMKDLRQECQSTNHKVPQQCRGGLWQCSVCKKMFCCAEGADDDMFDVCDSCYAKLKEKENE